jgi:hypothetical protein
MAIRPPRAARRPRRTRLVRDIVIVMIVSAVVLLFGLRLLMELIGIETWTATWRVVDLPTGLLVDPLERVDSLAETPISDLSYASLIVAGLSFVGALIVLGTLANRRE